MTKKLAFDIELTASSMVNIIKNTTGLKVEAVVQTPVWDTDSGQILVNVMTPKKNIVLGHFTLVESAKSQIQSFQSNFRGILGTEAMSEVVEKLQETLAKYNEINQKEQ